MKTARTEITVTDKIVCIVTASAARVTAEVIDFSGVGPTKYDCEDALYAAKDWIRRNAKWADGKFFTADYSQGEVAAFVIAR